MKELTFNISDIFNKHSPSGCLTQYDASFYHIPAYQRGYKWGSGKNGAVTILLNDLWNAFQNANSSNRKEFYLQYVTVKPIQIKNDNTLEVIDGQQRLTTLSIILSSIAAILNIENIASGKLDYAIRDNFFLNHIYKKDGLEKLVSQSWEEISKTEENNKQDIYYLYMATHKCHQTFTSSEYKKELSKFYQYLLEYIILIVNSVETHIISETVFKNLNSNKVLLTESELIKGLFITKVGRQNNSKHKNHFQEIIEIRTRIGRQWDELTTWANIPEISSYFFNNHSDGMYKLLYLTAMSLDHTKLKNFSSYNDKDFPLFNFYLEHNEYLNAYDKIIEIKNALDNWYNSSKIYNLIGYNRYTKNSSNNDLKYLLKLLSIDNKSKLLEVLETDRQNLIKDIDLKNLSYTDTPNNIHHILLSINVFIRGREDLKFDFYNYENKKWTLEHIFPQTPEGKNNILKDIDKSAIIDLLGKFLEPEVEKVLKLDKREEQEKDIYYKALKQHPALNSIGNMCFLTDSDNSSNSNMFFNEKRENILRLIQTGSFVPKHTFEVFSKMFEGADINQMTIWTKQDIENNLVHITSSLNIISNE